MTNTNQEITNALNKATGYSITDEIKLSHAIEAMESYSQTERDKAWNKAIAQAIYLIENRGTWAELVEELQKLRK